MPLALNSNPIHHTAYLFDSVYGIVYHDTVVIKQADLGDGDASTLERVIEGHEGRTLFLCLLANVSKNRASKH